ncbi:hypothetical protein K6L44_00145 [Gluconacetobacter entanii]|nr:hypothetical protein [Gluconacetobacter entanii]MCW4578929.1 WcbI family polysaccharide biosynthesis putative acetyltransferase [Gluconacetobacter entanii]MCW4582311.1 WcbI family polysaccharide biosynthesis putative acetyltransferase [Gluconacetobacter entanii]MCW4585692.1 WcbI family polysaccharide biosynthesis putative acetyltransferase [Gluconacetobacter entanii]
MERWILLSNCQTYGLANSMQLLNNGIEIMPVDVGLFRQNVVHYNESFSSYDRVILTHEVETTEGADFSGAKYISRIPALSFAGYHPDIVYVTSKKSFIRGPIGDYHSMIALVAYKHGLNINQTRNLYNRQFYEACGYMDRWEVESHRLISDFRNFDLDIWPYIRQWAKHGPFMYSTNHPKIQCLFDMARVYLEKEGYAAVDSGARPEDKLAFDNIFAVYPEISENLGVEGTYLFKKNDSYKLMTLEEFLEQSFMCFDQYEADELTPYPHPYVMETYERLVAQFKKV